MDVKFHVITPFFVFIKDFPRWFFHMKEAQLSCAVSSTTEENCLVQLYQLFLVLFIFLVWKQRNKSLASLPLSGICQSIGLSAHMTRCVQAWVVLTNSVKHSSLLKDLTVFQFTSNTETWFLFAVTVASF